MRRTVLCLSSDPPPIPGHPVAGGGLRIAALGAGLVAHGHRVIHAVDARALPGGAPEGLASWAFTPGTLLAVVARARPDLILVEQWALVSWLSDLDVPLVVDLHGSLALENLYRRRDGRLAPDLLAKVEALARADHVLVPGHRQREWFSAFLALAGHDPRRPAVTVVPLGLPDEPGQRRPVPGLRLVHGGARWPWIDAEAALMGAAAAVTSVEDARLDLYLSSPPASRLLDVDGGDSPWPRTEAAIAGRPRVGVHPALPHAAYRDVLLGEANVALDVYRDNPERRLAMTTRTVEYLWAGLPVVYSRDGELAAGIEAAQAGWLVDAGDAAAVEALVRHLAAHPREVQARSRNARRLFVERHRAAAAAESMLPLLEVLPRRAKGPTALDEMLESRVALHRAELAEVRRLDGESRSAAQAAWDTERTELIGRALAAEEDTRAARAELRARAAAAEEDLRAARADVAERERRVARGEEDLRDLRGVAADLSRRDDAAREERQVHLREIDGLQRRVEGLGRERDGLLAEREELRGRIAALAAARDEAAGRERVALEHAGNVERDILTWQRTPAWRIAVRRFRAGPEAPPPPPLAGAAAPGHPPEQAAYPPLAGAAGPARGYGTGVPPPGSGASRPAPPHPGDAAHAAAPPSAAADPTGDPTPARLAVRARAFAGRAGRTAALIRLWAGEAGGNL